MTRPTTGAYAATPKRGRPKVDKPCAGPTCSKCRRMATVGSVKSPRCICLKGHALGTAPTCPDYSDASVQRPNLTGGTTGIPAR